MANPEYLSQLIDRASEAAGSDYRLAQQIHVSRQTVSDWRKGRKPCPVADIALIADVAGLDAKEWVRRAIVQQHEGTPKGARLAQVLVKIALATGGAAVTSGASAAQTGASELWTCFIRCIEKLTPPRGFAIAF
jgi:DNA-binding transcriptional regulator YdaS (Cro superfamily)